MSVPSVATLKARFVHPVPWHGRRSAVVTSGFRTSSRPGHDGVDLLYPLWASDGNVQPPNTDGNGEWWFPSGKSALAVADGEVVHSKLISSGGYIYVRHADGVASEYIHLATRLKRVGDFVRKGQPVGIVGAGDTHLTHLHFQMRIDGRLVNPALYLPHMPVVNDPRERNLLVSLGAGAAGFGLITLLLRS